ncbi:STY4851/ECs_5259 family protein [Marinomonas dokdonensis]|uniref:STY4851/ECs_5259 family protein n=1 Tax=Marinomonas dokdonensis TaxID=328224 RepID=UPI00405545AE
MDITSFIPVSCSSWLSAMFQKRGLASSNQKPLFTYQLTNDEYQELKVVIRRLDVSKERLRNAEWCAAFCLFCSEWYRREYKEGWSWDGIWNALDFKIEASQRPQLIERGLSYWGRKVNRYESDRNDFLGTVFSEGGLPFGLLANQGSRYQQLFKRLLNEFDKAKSFGVSPVPLIQKQLEGFPDAFQKETTVALLDEMVARLYGFIDRYDLDNQSDPVAHLDNSLPSWRGSFPIPLEDSTGNEFLAGLLTSAATQRKDIKQRQKRLAIQQWLSHSENIGFKGQVECDKRIQIPIGKSEFSHPNAELFLYEGKQQIKSLGRVRLECDQEVTTLHLRSTKFEFSRERWEAPLSLVVMQSGTIRYQEVIPDSSILLSDMPVVLEQVDGRHHLVGLGGVSKKAESLYVLTSSYFQALTQEESANIFSHEKLDGGYQFIHFAGELTLSSHSDDLSDQYVISTKADAFTKDLLSIIGAELAYESVQGYPVFKGVPKISCQLPSAVIYIGDSIYGKGEYLAAIYGRQVLRVKVGGKTLYRRKIAILPESLQIKIEAGNSPTTGAIYLDCEQNLTSKVTTDIATKIIKTDVGKSIGLIAGDTPPSEVELEVRANLLADPIVFRIPFPSKGALLVDADGQKLNKKVVVEELLGARALLFSEPGKGKTKFDIELQAPTRSKDKVSFNYTYLVSDSFTEISLYEFRHKIKGLLSTSVGLDETVRLIISSTSTDPVQYQIGRYTTSPMKEGDLLVFNEKEVGDFGSIQVELINLENPEEKPIKLIQRSSNSSPIGNFELPLQVGSPKLAVPSKTSRVSFRASYLAPDHTVLNTEKAKTLNKAVSEFHPLHNSNPFRTIFDDMAVNFSHSGWLYLDALFENFSHLPMSTFEVWKALAKHPLCLTSYPLASRHNTEDILQAFQTEFNIIWELNSLYSWSKALSSYKESLQAQAYPDELVKLFEMRELDKLMNFLGLPELFKASESNGAVYPALVNIWKGDLLRVNADNENWPSHYDFFFNQWLLNHKPELLCFEIPHKFQTAVALFPIIAAAVVSGKTTWSDVLGATGANYLLLRQLMDFDRDWFNSVFQCCLSIFATE